MEATTFPWRLRERGIKLWPFQCTRRWSIFSVKRSKSFYLLSTCLGLVIWFFHQESLLHPNFPNNAKPSSNEIEIKFHQESLLHPSFPNNAKPPSNEIEIKKPIKQLLFTKVIRERYKLMDEYLRESVTPKNPPFKKIVLWNSAYFQPGNDFRIGPGRNKLRKIGCPVWQCELTTERTKVQNADAVVFHYGNWTTKDLPAQRSSHQYYIFWNRETPSWRTYLPCKTNLMADFFNWTMTYRWNSDVVMPYGYIKPIKHVPLHPSDDQMKLHLSKPTGSLNYAKGKTKMAAWLVSNCKTVSGRNELVKELQKYVDVDVYGKCGTKSCSRTSESYCRNLATKTYKFYMALENALCTDYVTEKFFNTLQYRVIPIVYSLHGQHEKIAPRHSFINAAQFENTKQLADYMMLLDKNDTLYNQYFWWKPYFKVRNSADDQNVGYCHLCAALHNKTLIPPKVYHNMTEWWDVDKCVFSPKIF